ncbi:MAG: HAMP domain-containing histidine kinase [Calditrichaeota bacterium]|nr:HAMP domain-containing histidine kinase [Calditrichota bacterium]
MKLSPVSELIIGSEIFRGMEYGMEFIITVSVAILIITFLLILIRKKDQNNDLLSKLLEMKTNEIKAAGVINSNTISFLTDEIKQRHRLEVQNDFFAEELKFKNLELEKFLYTVSHDLKNPLITINNYLGLIQQENEGHEAVLNYIRVISSASKQMYKLLDDLIKLALIDKIPTRYDEFSMEKLISEIKRYFAYELNAGFLEFNIQDRLPVILGDEQRLTEVFKIIIDNSIKYRKPEQAVTIRLEHAESDNDYLFSISDDGLGIPPKYLEKVFDIFERLDPETDGTGIGLSIAKSIIQYHGGTIWIESDGENKGSTARISIPKKTNNIRR